MTERQRESLKEKETERNTQIKMTERQSARSDFEIVEIASESCNDNQTVRFNMSSSYSKIRIAKSRVNMQWQTLYVLPLFDVVRFFLCHIIDLKSSIQ